MKILIENTEDRKSNSCYSVELIQDDKVEELCKRQNIEDATKDARWYVENQYPSADIEWGYVNQRSLLNDIEKGKLSPSEQTNLPVTGKPPKQAKGETGLWSWNHKDRNCIIGEGDSLRVVSYKEANRIYS